MGVVIRYSKPLSAYASTLSAAYVTQPTHMACWRGCPAGGRLPHGECFLAIVQPMLCSEQSRSCLLTFPGASTLDGYTLPSVKAYQLLSLYLYQYYGIPVWKNTSIIIFQYCKHGNKHGTAKLLMISIQQKPETTSTSATAVHPPPVQS